MKVEPVHIEQEVWDNPGRVGLTKALLRYDVGTDGYFIMVRGHQVLVEDRATNELIRELMSAT